MSHPVNDEILEAIYEELVEEFDDIKDWTDNQIEDEVILRFEAMSM